MCEFFVCKSSNSPFQFTVIFSVLAHVFENQYQKEKLKLDSVLVVGSLASEFLGWSWKTHVGIPMLDIGIPTSEFQCPT